MAAAVAAATTVTTRKSVLPVMSKATLTMKRVLQQPMRRSTTSSSHYYYPTTSSRMMPTVAAAVERLKVDDPKTTASNNNRFLLAGVAAATLASALSTMDSTTSGSRCCKCEEPTNFQTSFKSPKRNEPKSIFHESKSKQNIPPRKSTTTFHVTLKDDEGSDGVDLEDKLSKLPIYTSSQVASHNGKAKGDRIWMSYGGIVYDVTEFIPNHPGGAEHILKAAGSSVEQYWHIYRQHFASDLPMKLMEKMIIGRLNEKDQERIDNKLDLMMEDDENDPYANEPDRDSRLIVHSDTPMNAEVPYSLITKEYLTPNNLFYIRHHHPVPYVASSDEEDEKIKDDNKFQLEIDLSSTTDGKPIMLSLEELKQLPKTQVITTLQCSGNRRTGFNNTGQRTSGTTWGQGAISTAKWGGVRLSTLLQHIGLDDPISAQENDGIEHVRFYGLDGMKASIGIEKAVNPYGDVLVAYEMNDEPIPRDHGYPIRLIVPGYAAVRNVKWVHKIELSQEEAEGPWQRGLNYKTLPPTCKDATTIDITKMPSMMESSVFSGITVVEGEIEEDDEENGASINIKPGDTIMCKVQGWAYAGGGRNVVRVDVTPDEGQSWYTANLKEGSNQRFGRAWAWVFWEVDVPCVVQDDGQVHLASKAVDMAFNAQPERADHGWNVRGLGNNSWFRVKASAAS